MHVVMPQCLVSFNFFTVVILIQFEMLRNAHRREILLHKHRADCSYLVIMSIIACSTRQIMFFHAWLIPCRKKWIWLQQLQEKHCPVLPVYSMFLCYLFRCNREYLWILPRQLWKTSPTLLRFPTTNVSVMCAARSTQVRLGMFFCPHPRNYTLTRKYRVEPRGGGLVRCIVALRDMWRDTYVQRFTKNTMVKTHMWWKAIRFA